MVQSATGEDTANSRGRTIVVDTFVAIGQRRSVKYFDPAHRVTGDMMPLGTF